MNWIRRKSSSLYVPEWIDRRGMEFAKRRGLDPSWLDYRDYGKWQMIGPTPMAMALVNTGGNLLFPRMGNLLSAAPAFLTTVIDADGEGHGVVFSCPRAESISKIGFATGVLTTGDANTLIRLEDLDGSVTPAIPNGLIAAGASGLVNMNASNAWFEATLTTPYPGSSGQQMAATITRQAGGTLNTQIRGVNFETNLTTSLPYSVQKVGGGGWTGGLSLVSCMALSFSGNYFAVPGVWPLTAITASAINNTTTPDVIGNVWVPRFRCRVIGFYVWIDMDGPIEIKFYNLDGVTVLAQSSTNDNKRASTGPGIQFLPLNSSLGPTSITPTVGGTYRIGVEPRSAVNTTVYDFTVNSPSIMDCFELGQNMYLTTAKDPSGVGSWTNTTNRRCWVGVIVDQLDDGTGDVPIPNPSPSFEAYLRNYLNDV